MRGQRRKPYSKRGYALRRRAYLISQESFTEDEAELIYGQLNFINTVIHEKLANKVQDMIELLDRL